MRFSLFIERPLKQVRLSRAIFLVDTNQCLMIWAPYLQNMPAATNKYELLAVFDKELQKLSKTLQTVDEAKAILSLPGDKVTPKGTLAHRTHWMGKFHGWYDDGVAGREVHLPAKGYKWNQLKDYNAPLYEQGDASAWNELLLEFDTACGKLRSFIESCEDKELYTHGLYAWTGNWTVGRYAEASGPSHFRSANTFIRKILRSTNAKQ